MNTVVAVLASIIFLIWCAISIVILMTMIENYINIRQINKRKKNDKD